MLFLPVGEGRKGEGGLRTRGYFKFSYKYIDKNWFICDIEGNPLKPAPADIQEKINNYIASLPEDVRHKMTELPLITVITVVLNGEKYLEQTIQSVINQTYPNVEYIIIDGGSTDGTLDIVKKYEDRIDYWVSEKDRGIYDAMNKGIDLANGKWINFMNSGDWFYDSNVIEKVFYKGYYQRDGVIYGNHNVVYKNRTKIVKAGKIENIWKGSQFCHQSSFVSAKIQKKNKFNLANRIVADFEFFYNLYKEGIKFIYIDTVMVNYMSGGISDKKRVDSIVGRWKILRKNNKVNNKVNIYYVYILIRETIKILLKKVAKYE
ncbi:MAG: glycosyltransferase family 2 protein [Candidatus Aenigmatarchaeota archaeon]